jgi:hypothetical protein
MIEFGTARFGPTTVVDDRLYRVFQSRPNWTRRVTKLAPGFITRQSLRPPRDANALNSARRTPMSHVVGNEL